MNDVVTLAVVGIKVVYLLRHVIGTENGSCIVYFILIFYEDFRV